MQGTKKPGKDHPLGKNRHRVRRSVSLPAGLAREVDRMAESKRASVNQVIVRLIEDGLESRREERERFFQLTRKLVQARTETERTALKQELARMTFGE